MKKLSIILTIALLLPVALNAKKVYESEKVVNHSFPASANHTLVVENKYGPINIVAWDKNEVSATITITGMSSRSQELADELANSIKINANTSGNTISLLTEFPSTKINNISGTHGNEISYEIKVPHSIAFKLTNKYGDIKVDKCGNTAAIDVKYGNFYCTKMTDENATLTLGYGNADIQDVNKLTADIKYSNFTLVTANTLNLTTKYSKFGFTTIGKLSVTSSYDKYKIGQVNTGDIYAKYTDVIINKVNESLSLINKYAGVTIDEVGENAKSLKLEVGYTDVKLNIKPNISYQLNANTKYGDISLPDNVANNIKHREKEGSSTAIQATVGSGTPSLTVAISNSYANIRLTAK